MREMHQAKETPIIPLFSSALPPYALSNHPSDLALTRGQDSSPPYLQLSIHLLIPFSSFCSFIPLRSQPPIHLRNNNVRPWSAPLANISRSSISSGHSSDFAQPHLWPPVTRVQNTPSAAGAHQDRMRRTHWFPIQEPPRKHLNIQT